MNLIFSSVFESDFAELVGYFQEQGGTTVSVKFEESLCRLTELLEKTPELGRLRRDLKPGAIRSFAVPQFRNYVLFYRVSGNDLIFLRVRFGGMDLPALFQS
jgi:plasmid stabilization system protein ParE